jgi:hypothetical protein
MTDKIIKEDISDLLMDYEPKSTYELAEWILMAATNLKDPEGKRILNPLEPYQAWQIARMMQAAKLKVPE